MGRWDKGKEAVLDLVGWFRRLQISVHAGNTCYFLILSAFPVLVLLLGLLRHTGLQAADLMDMVQLYLPNALQGYVWGILSGAYENTNPGVLSLSALTALWSGGRGIYGLMKGLDRINGREDPRSWLRTRLLCAVYLVVFLLILVLTLILHVFGNTLGRYLQIRGGLGAEMLNLRYFLLVGLQTLLFCALFAYLPGGDRPYGSCLPGALLASLGWMGVSGLFSLYVTRPNRYVTIFGSVYSVAMTMLWLYLCVSSVFYGAMLNRILEKAGRK